MTDKRGADRSERRPAGQRQREAARAATLRVIERHGPQVMRTARRYAATSEDAEDAYQRGIEIMLTKAPDIPDSELLPWLKTVVRHEAFALARKDQRSGRGGTDAEGEAEPISLAPTPGEQAERLERLRLGAEALSGLKPQEARALALLAQGYSYQQICDQTGWTYTKVNRCLAEGRRSFVQRVTRIESGAECERWAPTLSAFVDGEAKASDVALLRKHLQGCLACQSSLREHRLAPAVVAALLPLPLLDRAIWPLERLSSLASAFRVKVDSVLKLGSLDATTYPSHVVLAGGTRGIASTGLAKALALLCVGGVGVGGAAAVTEVLAPAGPPPAKAADGGDGSWRSGIAPPASPDPRLVAERLRAPDDSRAPRPSSERQSARSIHSDKHERRNSVTGSGLDVSEEPGSVDGPAPPSADRLRHRDVDAAPRRESSCSDVEAPRPAREPGGDARPSSRTRSDGGPVVAAERQVDALSDEYGTGAGPTDQYGSGAGPSDQYGTGAGPSDQYGAGAGPSDQYGSGAGDGCSESHE